MPTVQMVFRRSLQNVRSRADYFSAAAHPAAFEGFQINPARMVSLAQSIKPDAIPPRVRIRVTDEELGTEGRDFFGEGLSEQLFDTPSAIARVWRSSRYRRTMEVSAAETVDPNGRALSFEWHLLQGDPERVKIEPADGRPERADHPRLARALPHLRGQPAHDLAGRHRGLRQQRRARQRAGDPQLVLPARGGAAATPPAPTARRASPSIDYAGRPAAYADPMLMARADWRDDYHYAADGSLDRLDPHPRRPAGRLRRRRRAHPRPGLRRRAGPRSRGSPIRCSGGPTAASSSRRSRRRAEAPERHGCDRARHGIH